jgi:rod shape-determining protein MreC
MDNVISRFRNTANLIVLAAVLVLQIIGLAAQVKRQTESGPTRLIRVWAISVITPLTRGIVHTQDWFSHTWHDYVWLRGVRQQNEELQNQIVQMKMREVRLAEDANQARRLQLLLGFKEKYISQTVPAQVIATTGSEFSRAIYIDKGSNDGIKPDMPVITPEGIVGKVLRVLPTSSLVLLINDPTSGAGVILENSRLQGILKGTASGAIVVRDVMSDEKVNVGEHVVTSGGDRVFPKGMPVGTVTSVSPGQDLFLNIRVKPSAPIGRLEEVLVITRMDERSPSAMPTDSNPMRAIDILADRLPTVAPPPEKSEGVTNPASKAPSSTEGESKPVSKPTVTAAAVVEKKNATSAVQAASAGTIDPTKHAVSSRPAATPNGKTIKQVQNPPATKLQDSTKDTPH